MEPAGRGLADALKAAQHWTQEGVENSGIALPLLNDGDFNDVLQKDGDEAVFTTSFYYDLNEKTRNFTKKFVDGAKKKGIVKPFPHHVDAAAYDIVYVFKKAMEVAKITGDPSKLKEERTAIRDVLGKTQYDLISGKVCFDKNGDAQLPGYILTMKNKQWKLLETHAPLPCS